MVRLMVILCVACLLSAAFLSVRPDPWAAAEQKAALDAQKLAALIESPDRIGWRMSEDVSLLRVMIWDAEGARRYPPPGGLVPLAYEFSEDAIRNLTSLMSGLELSKWASFDTAGRELLHCRPSPSVCLIYGRARLEDAVGLRPGDLASPDNRNILALSFGALALFFGAIAIWIKIRTRPAPQSLRIIPEQHIATRGELEVPLTPRDLKVLGLLEERDGAVVTKDELYDVGWGRDYMPNSRALDQHMINLRRKLDPDKSRPVLIETVHGVGYRLVR